MLINDFCDKAKRKHIHKSHNSAPVSAIMELQVALELAGQLSTITKNNLGLWLFSLFDLYVHSTYFGAFAL